MMEQVMNFFISSAYADAPGVMSPPGQQAGGSFFFIMLGVFAVFFYFAIWRPQNKRAKEQRELMNSLSKGDEVMTAGGLLGRVTKVTEQYVSLSVANNVDILLQKTSVVTILPKGTLKSIE